MIGRWLGNRTNRVQRASPLAAVQTPASAGVLSCRVLDPVNEPVAHAEFAVSDATGRKVVSGGTDPYGSFMTTVPAGSTGSRCRPTGTRRTGRPRWWARTRSPRSVM